MTAGTVATQTADPSRIPASRTDRIRMAALTLTVLATGYFLVESMLYSGISAWVNEWQFARLGYALPVLTFFLLAGLFCAPVWIIYRLVRPRSDAMHQPVTIESWREQAQRKYKMVDRVAITLVVLGFATLIWGMIVVGTATPVAIGVGTPSSGAQILPGTVDEGQAVTLSSSVIPLRQPQRFAPLIEPGRSRAVRYFVELPGDLDAPTMERERPLLRVRGQVPGAVVSYFRANGVKVARERYLLARSADGLQFPYRLGASLLVFAAFVAFLVARLHARRVRRLDVATRTSASTA